MSDSPQTPRTPNPRLHKEYEDPHYHEEDETAIPEDEEKRRGSYGQSAPRRKPVYRPRRRFSDE
jgi:hypothetical protein